MVPPISGVACGVPELRRPFADDLRRLFVHPETLKGGMTYLSVSGPFGEHNLGHERRLHPVRLAAERPSGWRIEGRACLRDGIELLPQLQRRAVGEACTDLSREDQLPALVVANQQRADSRAHA